MDHPRVSGLQTGCTPTGYERAADGLRKGSTPVCPRYRRAAELDFSSLCWREKERVPGARGQRHCTENSAHLTRSTRPAAGAPLLLLQFSRLLEKDSDIIGSLET
ncbi:unnamed protein product [Boreogadus saida]